MRVTRGRFIATKVTTSHPQVITKTARQAKRVVVPAFSEGSLKRRTALAAAMKRARAEKIRE